MVQCHPSRPYDLKAHNDVSSRRNLRHSVQGSGSSPDDQKARHSADQLKSDRSVLMSVVPVRPAWMITGMLTSIGLVVPGFISR